MAAESRLPVPAHDAEQVRRLVDEILARPEYAEPDPSLIEQGQRWLAERLGEAFTAVAGGGQAALIGSVLILALVAVAVVAAVRLARTVQGAPSRPVDEPAPSERDAAQWQAEARAHEQAGRHAEALRCRYRAALAALAAAGLIDPAPSRTPGEQLRAARTVLPAAAGAALAELTARFERVWYGAAGADPAAATAAAELATQVAEAAGGARR